MPGKIPNGWYTTPNISTIIETDHTSGEGLRFYIFKTLISNTSWTINALLTDYPEFTEYDSLIINMKPNENATDRYNPEHFKQKGIVYEEMYVYGNRKARPASKDDEFFRLVDEFVNENPDCVVGVHGTNVVDRPGYFVANYLIQRLGWSPDMAIRTVDTARGQPISANELLEELHKNNINSNTKDMVRHIPELVGYTKPSSRTTNEKVHTNALQVPPKIHSKTFMSKREQVLVIEPLDQLTFQGPFTAKVTSFIKLKNPSDKKVCFKIKTTAPKQYCVKPNSGVIHPMSEVQISVSLHPFEYDPTEMKKHKFMVQSLLHPDVEINQDTLRKGMEHNWIDCKLKCVFVTPQGELNNGEEPKTENTRKLVNYPNPLKSGDTEKRMSDAVIEIKKLKDKLSQHRQDNIALKDEIMMLKRVAAAREKPTGSPRYCSTSVSSAGPQNNNFPTWYIYGALLIFVLGIMLGKFFL